MKTIFPKQRPWTREAAEALLDMSGGLPDFKEIGAKQLDAAVALHRMLLAHGCAYLADEVGMGKTYVALATVALFRRLQPDFRVLYLAPTTNVLGKWEKRELPAFMQSNIRHAVMGEQGAIGSAAPDSRACMNVEAWLKCAVGEKARRDVFVPFSALSFQLTGEADNWYARVKRLAEYGNVDVNLTGVSHKRTFKDRAAEVVNTAIPRYDLVIIDEAHLLKSGAGASASDRAQFLARALGAVGHGGKRKFRAALLLSGTPFDRDLMQLARQFELFAVPRGRALSAPHEIIKGLAARRREGEQWKTIQEGLKPYMVRRVQKLIIGDTHLSRNQYRRELRAEAGISLANDMSPDVLQQRVFTAVVQKRLIEHVDGVHAGHFPMAMFSSWEAYSLPAKAAVPAGAHHGDADDETPSLHAGDALDVSKDDDGPRDARALDGMLMEHVVGSYRDVFDKQPPHPKLEAEANRLGKEAFFEGLKQLVFVRRLKSVDDLYLRLNEAYDAQLGEYLRAEGMRGCPDDLMDARRAAGRASLKLFASGVTDKESADGESEALPPNGDTLFTWFFRGELDSEGQSFIDRHQLPRPSQLRERLRDDSRLESIIGELDWRGFLTQQCPGLPHVSFAELTTEAAQVPGPSSPLMRYRRLQAAWARLQSERLRNTDAGRSFEWLAAYLESLCFGTDSRTRAIDASHAKALLALPTVALALYRRGIGMAFLPQWSATWKAIASAEKNGFGQLASARKLTSLDLMREVMFALLRLDHPFVDLYLGWCGAKREDGHDAAKCIVERIVDVCARDSEGQRFGTASILRNLVDAWQQIAKTNFSDLLRDTVRSDWRKKIREQLFPFAPVEWASGQNTDSRSAIARRFRMPGYPMVLVSTSVLQEGEDLHVSCDRVTHFGISGSPIGIEQKNGRVDRIGSRAQRRLLAGQSVAEAGIQVRFPHLTESLEWFQIRDLSLGINDYLHSIHEVGTHAGADGSSQLAQTMANQQPIPALLPDRLESPFEPHWVEEEGELRLADIMLRHTEAP